jgi:hypothetical protein
MKRGQREVWLVIFSFLFPTFTFAVPDDGSRAEQEPNRSSSKQSSGPDDGSRGGQEPNRSTNDYGYGDSQYGEMGIGASGGQWNGTAADRPSPGSSSSMGSHYGGRSFFSSPSDGCGGCSGERQENDETGSFSSTPNPGSLTPADTAQYRDQILSRLFNQEALGTTATLSRLMEK